MSSDAFWLCVIAIFVVAWGWEFYVKHRWPLPGEKDDHAD